MKDSNSNLLTTHKLLFLSRPHLRGLFNSKKFSTFYPKKLNSFFQIPLINVGKSSTIQLGLVHKLNKYFGLSLPFSKSILKVIQMSYIYYNPNPRKLSVGDCTIRAISCALNLSWTQTYLSLLIQGYRMYDMPSANRVWGEFLKSKGFQKFQIPDTCPDCYTIKDFCYDNPIGTFILGTGEHVVCVIDGNYYDSWD